jgi:predicted ribosome quality control (RQC) complex YloA/Tae2 family protein
MRDLIAHNALNIENAKLLKCGRHFRLSDDVKIVVGRDEADNATLESFAREGDIMFKLKYRQGPISLLRGAVTDESIEKAASIAAYHTKLKDEALVAVNFWRKGENARRAVEVRPASADEVEALRI